MKYIKGLDTLRAFAVFFVIITHWGPHTIQSSKVLTIFLTRILPSGEFGVDLFFVLSGFLITNILLNAKAEATPKNRLGIVKAFYIRRSLRIFPIYFLLVGVMYLMNDPYVKNNLIYFLTYTSNFLVFNTKSWTSISHTWSLAVEEQFYLIWPWIIIFSPKKLLFSISIAFIIVGLTSSFLFEHMYGSFFYVLPLPCFTAFAVGALFACSQLTPGYQKKVKKAFLLLLPLGIFFFFLYQFGYRFAFVRAVNAIIAVNLIIYVVEEKYNVVTEFILNNNFLAGIGKISYGIYLYHYIIPGIYYNGIDKLSRTVSLSSHTIKLLKNPPSSYLIHLMLALVISWLSYYFFEQKIIKLKRKFLYVPHGTSNVKELSNG